MKYRHKVTEVEAMQWTGDNQLALQQWGAACYEIDPEDRGDNPDATLDLYVAANGRWLALVTGEWIIHDTEGCYPCSDRVFSGTYTPVAAQEGQGT